MVRYVIGQPLHGLRLLIFAVSIICIWHQCAAQDSTYVKKAHIARFKGDRAAAVVYSFDDGIKDQFDIAYPMLRKLGFTATFFVIPAQIPLPDITDVKKNPYIATRITSDHIRQMANQGFEIAGHSWSHSKNLTTLDDKQLWQEIDKADSAITRLTGHRPLTFAYPWNAYNAKTQAAVLKNHIAAREFQFGIGNRFTTADGNQWVDNLIKRKTWGITMIHAITDGFDALKSPNELEQHFNYVKAHEKDIWVTNFATLTKYIKERDSTRLQVQYRSKDIIMHMRNPLNNGVFNEPLTIVLSIPTGYEKVTVTQGGKQLPVTLMSGEIIFDAMPLNQPVRITKK